MSKPKASRKPKGLYRQKFKAERKSFRFPKKLNDALDGIAQHTGTSQTELVVESVWHSLPMLKEKYVSRSEQAGKLASLPPRSSPPS